MLFPSSLRNRNRDSITTSGGRRVSENVFTLKRPPSDLLTHLDAPNFWEIQVTFGVESNVPSKTYIPGAGSTVAGLAPSSELQSSKYAGDYLHGRHDHSVVVLHLDGHTAAVRSQKIGKDFFFSGWYNVHYKWVTTSMFSVW